MVFKLRPQPGRLEKFKMVREKIVAILLQCFLLFSVLVPFSLAAGLVAALLASIGFRALPLLIQGALLPVVLLAWLVLLMLIYCGITTIAGFFVSKPRRATGSLHSMSPGMAFLFYQYAVYSLLEATPFLVNLLRDIAPLRLLFFRSFSTRCRLPLSTAGAAGTIQDPDIIHIDRSVVVGHGARLVAHSLVVDDSGRYVYQSAPIRIHSGATIGGDTLVELGVSIGRNAMIEPFSRVPAYTVVPDGEVWGGVPARFLRRRFEDLPVSVQATNATVLPTSSDEETLQLIATSLGVDRGKIDASGGSNNCDEWDSLGQMSIAASLQLRHGIKLSPEQIFSLNSVQDVLAHLQHPNGIRPSDLPLQLSLPRDPELLPLLDHGRVTSALLARGQSPDLEGQDGSIHVVVAATFVAEPLAQALRLWSRAFGVAVSIEFAGFNQVTASLLDPGSPFGRNRDGINLVLARPEDLMTLNDVRGEKVVDAIFSAAQKFMERGGSLMLANLPAAVSPFSAIAAADFNCLLNDWSERMNSLPGLISFDFAAIVNAVGADHSPDPDLEIAASTPYSREVYDRLGIALARVVRRRRIAAKKVIALDGDGTLWQGVLGEDGMEGVRLSEGHAWFQRRLIELKEKGALLVIVSKNEPEDVWELLEVRADFPLNKQDFVAHRIGWKPKSEALRELAVELNVGLDSFLFIDDSPTERATVEAGCPEVTVLPLPADSRHYASQLNRLWCFDALGATMEDASRHSMVQAEARRRELAAKNDDLEAYLKSLGLEVRFSVAAYQDVPRLAQLSQKTNQFNLSLRRRDEDAFRALLADGAHQVWKISVVDQFGEYGIVGLIIARLVDSRSPVCLEIESFMLSCRALGRGVEEAALHALCCWCQDLGVETVVAPYVVAPRNSPVRDFFRRQGFSDASQLFRRPLLPLPVRPGHVNLIVQM
jgi:FkbH-like protein